MKTGFPLFFLQTKIQRLLWIYISVIYIIFSINVHVHFNKALYYFFTIETMNYYYGNYDMICGQSIVNNCEILKDR
jgi:hypothetical protein